MKIIYSLLLPSLFCSLTLILISQNKSYESLTINEEYANDENDVNHPCISEDQYRLLESNCNTNSQLLGLQILNTTEVISLAWPLQATSGLKDCSYYRISAYVDQNTASGAFQDFNCGINTYDGHRGTDISIWPNNFYKMDNNLVKVIAAAAGTIIDKHDGEFDKNCSGNNQTANYLVIQHTDGSRALYFHMKKNSLTSKSIGQPVAEGEFLGIVGSSGSSSGPHLHFEVWSGATIATRIDPFAGSCNSLNQNSCWKSQKAYKETAIIKASTNTTDIVIPPCPGTEILNESDVFQLPFQGTGLPAGYAKFYIYIRDEVNGLIGDMSILNPDGSTYMSWTYNSTSDNKIRIQGWSKKLPTVAGKYLFKSSYNGTTCSSAFELVSPTHSYIVEAVSAILIYPNPSNGIFTIETNNSNADELEIYNLLNSKIFQSELIDQKTELLLSIPGGVYFYKIKGNHQIICTGKLVKE